MGSPPEAAEFEAQGEDPVPGGLCPDFSHLENARLHGRLAYMEAMDSLFAAFPVGCRHLSAIRIGVANIWNGEWDHRSYAALSDLDYLSRYGDHLPRTWASLELENGFEEQGEAVSYLAGILSGP